MFGRFFRPTCPCDIDAKRWVESRLGWLDVQFPRNVFRERAMIIPTIEHFPEPYDATDACVIRLADRIARVMGVDFANIDLEIDDLDDGVELVDGDGRAVGGVAGLYAGGPERRCVSLCRSQLGSPMNLVGTIAHEFAHERLMGEGRVGDDEFDNELLTDLTVVHFGLGIFLANSPRNWPADQKFWPNSKLVRPEYMSPPMFGYALAHVAWHANNRKPEWARYLGQAVRADFQQSVRYLFETRESAFVRSGTG
ncbi:MAG: hypothetical protein ACKVS9_01055 [Phycisphaerae bacterium]